MQSVIRKKPRKPAEAELHNLLRETTAICLGKVRANIQTRKLEPLANRPKLGSSIKEETQPTRSTTLPREKDSSEAAQNYLKSYFKKTSLENCTSSSLPYTGRPAEKVQTMQLASTTNAHKKRETTAQDGLPSDRRIIRKHCSRGFGFTLLLHRAA